MNENEIKKLLKELKIKSSKFLGQNFLKKEIVSDVVKVFNISKNDNILEIGPGLGSLTDEIYKNCKELILIEKDTRLFNFLKLKYKDFPKIKIFNKDVLDFDFSLLEKEKYRVISNLPFNSAIKILKYIFNYKKFFDFQLSFSKEVADKFLAKSKTKLNTFITVFFNSYFEIEKIYKIKSNCFIPVPKVDVVFLRFKTKNKKTFFDNRKFYNFVSNCFLQKRKTLFNNLKKKYVFNKKDFDLFLNNKNFKSSVRSEWFSYMDFIDLYNFLKIK